MFIEGLKPEKEIEAAHAPCTSTSSREFVVNCKVNTFQTRAGETIYEKMSIQLTSGALEVTRKTNHIIDSSIRLIS